MTKKKNSKRETLVEGMRGLSTRAERLEKFSMDVHHTIKDMLVALERAENFLMPLVKILVEKEVLTYKELIEHMNELSVSKTLADYWDIAEEELEKLIPQNEEDVSEDVDGMV